jgi:hypothetical protein
MEMSLEAVKEAIGNLPEQDRVALAAWLNFNSMDDWDREMQRDFSPGGRAHHLIEKIRTEIREGQFGPMPGSESTGETH